MCFYQFGYIRFIADIMRSITAITLYADRLAFIAPRFRMKDESTILGDAEMMKRAGLSILIITIGSFLFAACSAENNQSDTRIGERTDAVQSERNAGSARIMIDRETIHMNHVISCRMQDDEYAILIAERDGEDFPNFGTIQVSGDQTHTMIKIHLSDDRLYVVTDSIAPSNGGLLLYVGTFDAVDERSMPTGDTQAISVQISC